MDLAVDLRLADAARDELRVWEPKSRISIRSLWISDMEKLLSKLKKQGHITLCGEGMSI